jgi:hypothetical protein
MPGKSAVRRTACFTLAGLCAALGLSAHAAESSMRDRADANDLGIWKSYSPQGLRGEFHNYDPVGLMAGALIHTDCSINWTDPDNGKTYCFSSGTSQVYFRDWPKTYAAKAAKVFQELKDRTPTE